MRNHHGSYRCVGPWHEAVEPIRIQEEKHRIRLRRLEEVELRERLSDPPARSIPQVEQAYPATLAAVVVLRLWKGEGETPVDVRVDHATSGDLRPGAVRRDMKDRAHQPRENHRFKVTRLYRDPFHRYARSAVLGLIDIHRHHCRFPQRRSCLLLFETVRLELQGSAVLGDRPDDVLRRGLR